MELSSNLELFGQLTLAIFLGALIGIERTLAKKEVGMRTFAFVSLGSALFSIISVHALEFIPFSGIISFDPTRIAAQIVSGVGFIGAGVIIFTQSKLQGVTTAAGFWLASAIGMAVGFGFYVLAIFATALSLTVLALFWLIEEKYIKKLSWYRSPHDGENF